MALTLDHLVILVHDLEATIADYSALGFTVQRGGTHADGNTHNALVGFADGSYLELIAFLKPAPQHRWGAAAATGREGFVDFALLPGSVGAVVEAARARGLACGGPLPGGRLRPDGERLAWEIGTPPSPELPFLCGDITPRALRVREGDVRVHANGVQGVASITIAVRDLEASLARYRALLGPDALQTTRPLALPGQGLRVAQFSLGAAVLVLVAPGPDAPQRAREGIVGVALRSTAPDAARVLAVGRTHGAHFEIHPA